MCGIYGTTLRYKPEDIGRKLELMRFRGPDYVGSCVITTPDGQKVTLGHVRLSIIDLDARSNQPFIYNDDISIVFNGEIYNYKELRSQYLPEVTFRTQSDTEVICALYEKYGLKSVSYLNGMFAYVIYDKRKNILVGARDRLGKKPFYYSLTEKGFEFASQPKVIQYGNNFQIDETSRQLYLMHGWIPDPYSIFKEIKKLGGGEYFTYSLETKKMHIEKYWDLFSNTCKFAPPKSYEEAKERVKDLLFDAVKIRLEADVPVGAFLSGGIDSSLVCAIISKLNKNVCAYTAEFDNSSYDESNYAVTTAQHLGIPVKKCKCKGEDLLKVFDDYLYYFDEPFADDSLIPTSLVAQEARKDVTVILGGDGGDELFYGYPKYEWTLQRLKQYEKPYWLRKMLKPYYHYRRGSIDAFQSTQKDYADVYETLGFFCYDLNGAERFDRLVLAKKMSYGELLRNKERGVMAYSDYDMRTFMNGVNMKVDRATMRSSLESRSPIQDYRVAEYSRLLPYEYQYGKYGLKTILKDILYEMVPLKLLDRPKMGFVPPTSDWFRGKYKEEFLDIISLKNINDYLPEIAAEECIESRNCYLDKEMENSRMFFSLYTYIKWHKRYM